MREALCTLHNIGCSAHSLAESGLNLCFYGSKGLSDTSRQGFYCESSVMASVPTCFVCTCVWVCVFVCRLMTTGARNATDSCFTQTTRSLATMSGNALGQEHDFLLSSVTLSIPSSLHHPSLPFTWATSLMIAQWLWVYHASFNQSSGEAAKREREREKWESEKEGREERRKWKEILYSGRWGGWKGTTAEKKKNGEAENEKKKKGI